MMVSSACHRAHPHPEDNQTTTVTLTTQYYVRGQTTYARQELKAPQLGDDYFDSQSSMLEAEDDGGIDRHRSDQRKTRLFIKFVCRNER